MKLSTDPQALFPRLAPWALSTVVTLLAIYVWGHSLSWQFGGISPYQFFPLLGLIGFSIMWSHYVNSLLHQTVWQQYHDKNYFRVTSYVVLLAIVLHPGILIYQRLRDGFGLPPKSYETYVRPGLGWITLLGSVGLLIFLAYELHRWYSKRPWWKYVVYAGDAAMLAIFYHGLRLGTQLQSGWFRYVWYFYGLSLVGILLTTYICHLRTNEKSNN